VIAPCGCNRVACGARAKISRVIGGTLHVAASREGKRAAQFPPHSRRFARTPERVRFDALAMTSGSPTLARSNAPHSPNKSIKSDNEVIPLGQKKQVIFQLAMSISEV
jgi:hypothetical protein